MPSFLRAYRWSLGLLGILVLFLVFQLAKSNTIGLTFTGKSVVLQHPQAPFLVFGEKNATTEQITESNLLFHQETLHWEDLETNKKYQNPHWSVFKITPHFGVLDFQGDRFLLSGKNPADLLPIIEKPIDYQSADFWILDTKSPLPFSAPKKAIISLQKSSKDLQSFAQEHRIPLVAESAIVEWSGEGWQIKTEEAAP